MAKEILFLTLEVTTQVVLILAPTCETWVKFSILIPDPAQQSHCGHLGSELGNSFSFPSSCLSHSLPFFLSICLSLPQKCILHYSCINIILIVIRVLQKANMHSLQHFKDPLYIF